MPKYGTFENRPFALRFLTFFFQDQFNKLGLLMPNIAFNIQTDTEVSLISSARPPPPPSVPIGLTCRFSRSEMNTF